MLTQIRPLLFIDAATCIATGALMVAAAGPLAALTSIPADLLFYAGLLLLPIALFMSATGWTRQPAGWAVALVIAGNVGWVLASLALPVSGIVSPNVFGWTFILVQAAVVALLALLEYFATRREPAHAV